MRQNRRNLLLIALAVGIVTLVGLAIHGPIGGVLLLLVAATLILLSSRAGAATSPRRDGSQAVRVAIVALVLLIAVIKLLGKS